MNRKTHIILAFTMVVGPVIYTIYAFRTMNTNILELSIALGVFLLGCAVLSDVPDIDPKQHELDAKRCAALCLAVDLLGHSDLLVDDQPKNELETLRQWRDEMRRRLK